MAVLGTEANADGLHCVEQPISAALAAAAVSLSSSVMFLRMGSAPNASLLIVANCWVSDG
jgi:hypothetical protein